MKKQCAIFIDGFFVNLYSVIVFCFVLVSFGVETTELHLASGQAFLSSRNLRLMHR